MYHSRSLEISTTGRGTYDITKEVQEHIAGIGASEGLCTLFIHHTSASLIVCENADPSVRSDLERFFAKQVPDGDPMYEHDMEGPDDMPAHIRSILTQSSLSIPIRQGRCDLGTWQGLYLWEHRTAPHKRRITLSVISAPR